MSKALRYVLGWIGTATAILLTSAFAIFPTSSWSRTEAITVEEAVEYVCSFYNVTCDMNHLPQVVYTDIGLNYGIYYPSIPDVVFLHSAITDQKEKNYILIHEISHFVDYHYGLTDMSSCATEGLAWTVANKWAVENKGTPRWNWWESYDCGRSATDGMVEGNSQPGS